MHPSKLYLCACFGLLVIIKFVTGVQVLPNVYSNMTRHYYPLRRRPDLDTLDPIQYFRTRGLVKLQVRCVFYDGPCDVVGQWAKPRLQTGLLGKCLECTRKQREWLSKVLGHMSDKFPDMFHAAVARVLEFYGQIELPKEHRQLVAEAFER